MHIWEWASTTWAKPSWRRMKVNGRRRSRRGIIVKTRRRLSALCTNTAFYIFLPSTNTPEWNELTSTNFFKVSPPPTTLFLIISQTHQLGTIDRALDNFYGVFSYIKLRYNSSWIVLRGRSGQSTIKYRYLRTYVCSYMLMHTYVRMKWWIFPRVGRVTQVKESHPSRNILITLLFIWLLGDSQSEESVIIMQ